MRLAIGLSVHTGWAAAVVAGGSAARPHVGMRARLDVLPDEERFVFHRAAELPLADAETLLTHAWARAVACARAALAALVTDEIVACAIVARPGAAPPLPAGAALAEILSAHPRLHTAEGAFYRDVLLAASPVRASVISPASLDVAALALPASAVGRPWARDQKLAALAAWRALAAR